MVYKVNVINKNNNMSCFIYEANTLDKLMITLQHLGNIDTTKYRIKIENKEGK